VKPAFEARGLQIFPECTPITTLSGAQRAKFLPPMRSFEVASRHMHQHGQVDATKIGIVVRGGQVLLWGSVASEHERSLAGELASRLTGRTAVINHIQVYRTTQS
jgi:hypothetical protein